MIALVLAVVALIALVTTLAGAYLDDLERTEPPPRQRRFAVTRAAGHVECPDCARVPDSRGCSTDAVAATRHTDTGRTRHDRS